MNHAIINSGSIPRRPASLLKVLCTFILSHVSTGYIQKCLQFGEVWFASGIIVNEVSLLFQKLYIETFIIIIDDLKVFLFHDIPFTAYTYGTFHLCGFKNGLQSND